MAKILKNVTVNNISITDTGITILASSSYTIPSQDYVLWAASSDVITYIGSADILVNDGSYDLSKADGISLLQGNFKQIDFTESLKDNFGNLKVSIFQESPNDYLSKVSSNDSTAGYLEDKIIGASNKISVSTLNDGSFEEIQINVGSDIFDKSVDDADDIINVPSGNISSTTVQSALNELQTNIDELTKSVKYKNILIVKLENPGPGEFTSIKVAADSITDSSDTNRYLILVDAGLFEEDEITLPPYVSVAGHSIQSTQVKVKTTSQHLFVLSQGCELSFMSLLGLYGTNKSAINIVDAGDFVQTHKLSIYDFDIGIQNSSVSNDSILYVEYTDINGDYTYAVKALSSFGNKCSINLENFYCYESTTVGAKTIYATGQTTDVQIFLTKIYASSTQDGVVFDDGTLVALNGLSIKNANVAIHNLNNGAGSTIRALAASLYNNNQDILIENINSSGDIFGTFDRNKVDIDPNTNISLLFTDSTNEGISINGPLFYSKQDIGNISDISDLLIETPTMGKINGGELSIGTGLNITIQAGFGYLNMGTYPNNNIKRIEWNTQNLLLSANSLVNIYVNSSGVIVANSTYPDTTQNIYLGRAITNVSLVLNVENVAIQGQHFSNKLSKALREAYGPVFSTGCLVSENGTRQLNVTQGTYYYGEVELKPTGASPITFFTAWKSTTPGLFNTLSGQTTVSNTQYDDSSGTLVSIPTNKYVKHLLVVVGGPSENYVLVYGDALYDTLLDAQNAPTPNTGAFSRGSFARIASIVVKEGQTNIQDIIDERPRIGFASSSSVGGVTSHSALSDLGNDDHTQYLLTSGSRSMSDNLDMGTNNIVNVGTVDGVDISSHVSRHLPNGLDPLTTGVPSTIGSTNQEGILNAFARQDHIHKLPDIGTPGTYGSATQIPVFTTDAEGRVTSVTNTSISTVSNVTYSRNARVTQISTTSTSYVLMTDMSVTPASGTYLVLGRATMTTTSNSRFLNIAIYRAGSLVTDSEVQTYIRTGSGFLSNSDIGNPSTDAVVTVNGSQTVELRWKTSGGTAQAQGYSLILIKVG